MGKGEWGCAAAVQAAAARPVAPVAKSSIAVCGKPAPFPLSRSPRAKRAARGFSLIEIIAALLLLAIAFAALMQVAGGSIGLTNNAADHSQAAMWARSLLDSAGVEKPLQAGQTQGKFDDDYHWRMTVTPYQVPDAGTNNPSQMFQVDVDVMWGGVRQRSAHFSTLRLVTALPQQGLPQ